LIRRSRHAVDVQEKLVGACPPLVTVLWMLGPHLSIGLFIVSGGSSLSALSRLAWSYGLFLLLLGTTQLLAVRTNRFASDKAWWTPGQLLPTSHVACWFLIGTAIGIGANGDAQFDKLLDAVGIGIFCSGLLLVSAFNTPFASLRLGGGLVQSHKRAGEAA
jgi:hypothetical protein